MVKNVFFFVRLGWSEEVWAEVQHLIKFMMNVVVNDVIDEYHKTEMTKKKFDKVRMMNCDICHDRPNCSSWSENNNKNKNMRRLLRAIKSRINMWAIMAYECLKEQWWWGWRWWWWWCCWWWLWWWWLWWQEKK